MLQNVTTAYNAKNLEEFMPEELNDNKEVAKAEKKLEQAEEELEKSLKELKKLEDEMDDVTTTERMYFLSKSLKRDSRYLVTAAVALVILIGVMIVFTGIFYASMDLWGTITHIETGWTSDDLLDQQIPCDEFWMDTRTCWKFEPHEGIIPEEVVSKMYQSRDSMTVYLWFLLIPVSAPLFFTYLKLRSTRNEMQEVADEYIQDSYFLNMELANPKGRNKAEKIFNLLKSVFPEVRLLSEREPDMKFEGTDVSGYEFALNLDTKGGKIGVMFFDKLTYEELEIFTKKVNGEFAEENDRIICIAKEFGDEFHQWGDEEIDDMGETKTPEAEEFRDELEEKMSQLDVKGHIDLIKEEKSSYSIMWID